MAQICSSVTTYVTQQVTNPISSWVNQQQQQCKAKPWPLNWFCWFVTILVEVINWVVSNILVPVVSVVCVVITSVIGGVLLPFGAAIDAVCQKCNAYTWIKDWFIGCSKIEGLTQTPSKTTPNMFDFTFKCNCNCAAFKIIEITAKTEKEAIELAKIECKKICK